jgi:hypothetical protein
VERTSKETMKPPSHRAVIIGSAAGLDRVLDGPAPVVTMK